MINSRSKGARGEREWRDVLRDNGFRAERGQQRSGSPDSPDVKCPDIPDVHFEVKRVQKLNVNEAMQQATRDAGINLIPVLAHRKNGERWKVTMWADNWFALLKESEWVQ